jgi:hypothetical protein
MVFAMKMFAVVVLRVGSPCEAETARRRDDTDGAMTKHGRPLDYHCEGSNVGGQAGVEANRCAGARVRRRAAIAAANRLA